MFYSEYRIECRNECGDVETRSVTSDTAYVVGGSCDDDVNCGSELFVVNLEMAHTFCIKNVLLVESLLVM